MAIKVTQNYKLATLLQSGELVTVETITETLGISKVSVAVYIFDLRKKFKADIENIKEGTKVIAYRLRNKINVPQYRTNNNQVEKKPVVKEDVKTEAVVDGSVPILDKEAGTLDDRSMADLHDQLGLNEFGSSFNLDNV
jgi:biotin operon repressor